MSTALTSPAATAAAPAWNDRTPLARLVRVELRKMVDTRSGRWLLFAALLSLIGALTIGVLAGAPADRSFNSLAQLAQLPVAIVLPVLGILAATSEWNQRTVLTTFALTPARGRVIAAKTLAAVLLAVTAFIVAVACAAVAAALAPLAGETTSDWQFGASMAAEFLVFDILNMLLGVAFGMALLNSAVAIVSYFVLPTVWAGISSAINGLNEAQEWLNTEVSWTHLTEADMTGTIWAQVATTALLWIVLPLAFGVWRASRREVH